MMRYFAQIRVASVDGSFVAERDDGIGRVFITPREAAAAGRLVVGDRIELSVKPGGIGADLLLIRHAKQLTAQTAK